MPISLNRGDRSPVVAKAIIGALHARLPVALEFVIGGQGRWTPSTHPQQLAKIIKTFYSRKIAKN
jgi:hypothetical protein